MKTTERRRKISDIVFICYIICVLWITLIDREATFRRSMLIPFWELRSVIENVSRNFFIKQIVCNIIMLMPFGYYLPLRAPYFRNWKRTVTAGLMFSAFIEITQYFTARGLLEFDDLLHNTIGCAIGYLIFCKLPKLF